jgi:hypothetical protein
MGNELIHKGLIVYSAIFCAFLSLIALAAKVTPMGASVWLEKRR